MLTHYVIHSNKTVLQILKRKIQIFLQFTSYKGG